MTPGTAATVDPRLAARAAGIVHEGFGRYLRAFLDITARAQVRFETRAWAAGQADAHERLDLYAAVIDATVAAVRDGLGAAAAEPSVWTAMREEHSRLVVGHPAMEIAETFFNSVTRRIFRTVGTNPAIEYLDFRFERLPGPHPAPAGRRHPAEPDTVAAVRAALEACGFSAPWADLAGDAARAGGRIARAWAAGGAPHAIEALEVLEPVFYRRKGAYLVGRLRGGNRVMPVVLALVHRDRGIAVDAVLLTEDEVSIVFSFTRSYFLAAVTHPAATIAFLRSLMPVKPVGELYNALGFHKHGKTEFWRHVQRHLARTDEKIVRAPGARGMVMEVFTLPSLDVVFKVIRDVFPPPKQVSADEVKRRYQMVFAHDRAGRLVDAQLFEGISFPRARFSRSFLAELLESASRSVRVEGDEVVVRHCYAERRVKPLDLFLADAEPDEALHAALDYGQTIRDLALTGVFAGDLLLKNFGVTRHGRVVFYDYDELRLLEECRFRDVPPARNDEDELMDEPYFAVGPDDVFPAELARFIPFSGGVRDAYLAAHACVYDPAWWRGLQERRAAGELADIYPYAEERRLRD
jgi:isocitrate dehydrogenase kinase/phosphatase